MAVSAGDRELDLIDSVIAKVTERLGHEPSASAWETRAFSALRAKASSMPAL